RAKLDQQELAKLRPVQHGPFVRGDDLSRKLESLFVEPFEGPHELGIREEHDHASLYRSAASDRPRYLSLNNRSACSGRRPVVIPLSNRSCIMSISSPVSFA